MNLIFLIKIFYFVLQSHYQIGCPVTRSLGFANYYTIVETLPCFTEINNTSKDCYEFYRYNFRSGLPLNKKPELWKNVLFSKLNWVFFDQLKIMLDNLSKEILNKDDSEEFACLVSKLMSNSKEISIICNWIINRWDEAIVPFLQLYHPKIIEENACRKLKIPQKIEHISKCSLSLIDHLKQKYTKGFEEEIQFENVSTDSDQDSSLSP